MKDVVKNYEKGLSVSEIAVLNNKSVSDLSQDDCNNILSMYKSEFSVLEISDIFQIPAPSVIKLLMGMGIVRVYHIGRKYEILKQTQFNKRQQEFIVGTLLGDGCIRYSDKLPRLCLVHSKKFEQYFFWKLAQLDKFFNLWREQDHPRKNSTLLYSETLQHSGLVKFYEMFYPDKIKIVPKNLDMYMTPYSLCVWFLDDGTLNSGTNHRIHTNGFCYNDQLELQSLLKRCFDLNCKIIQRADKQHILSFKRDDTVKLSNIIEPFVIPNMRYKLRLNLDTPQRLYAKHLEISDDIV